MNLEELKAEFSALLDELTKVQNGEMKLTSDELEAKLERSEELEKEIKSQERLLAITNKGNASKGRQTGAATAPSASKRSPQKEAIEIGMYFDMVKKAAAGTMDVKLQAYNEGSGEDGGFLVPEEMMQEVMKKFESDESLVSRTKQFTVSGNNLTLPIDETQPWNGGIQAYWLSESQTYLQSKSKFGQASWKLHKIGVLVPVTDELLEDSTALASYIMTMAPLAIMHKVNSAIISGDGVGKPTGILKSDFRVRVAKESGQLADTIVARNIINMFSRMLPNSRANGVWIINAMVEPALRTLKDDDGKFIYLAPGSELNQAPYGQLMGRPVIPMIGSMPALGDEGDIVFVDFSYYYTLLKSGGMKQAVSAHLLFDRDQQAYKFTLRIDGSCPFKAPVKTEFGDYAMSGIVTLEDRA